MTRSTIALLFAASFAVTALPEVASAQKIGVVDMQRALAETEDGRKAQVRLKKLFEQRQKMLDKQQTNVKTLKESIEKQRAVLSQEVLAKKAEEYQKALLELQNVYMEFQRELASKEDEMTKPIVDRMRRIMRRIGQSDSYALILERGEAGVIYVPTTYDLTDVLIQRYNSGEGRAQSKSRKQTKQRATSSKAASKSN